MIEAASHVRALVCALGIVASAMVQAMSVPGQYAVSESGAATYAIPVQVAPGVAGMEPKLTISYSSQSGGSTMGPGWGLSGLSAISRCPRTKAQDDVRGSVNYDLNDRYCLDGQRLMVVSGSYGADGSQYRTELESFAKVTAHGNTGSGPLYFIVKTKAGLTHYYGESGDSRIETGQGGTAVATWALSRTHDTKSNHIIYKYLENNANGEWYPDRIHYSFASDGVSRADVRFEYDPAYDALSSPLKQTKSYHAGRYSMVTKRLKTVAVYSLNERVRDYRFAYSTPNSLGQYKLLSVTQCGLGGAACLAPTSFDWGPDPYGGFHERKTTVPPAFGAEQATWVGDFNGDGRLDIASALYGEVYMHLGNGVGFDYAMWPVPSNWGVSGFFWSGDFNGDGKTDVASARNGDVYVNLSTGNGFAQQNWTVPPSWGQPEHTWAADFNGDGLTDLASAQNGNVYMKLSTGSGFDAQNWTVPIQWGVAGFFWVGDFNGDGKADIASAHNGNVYMKLSTGSGFVSQVWTVPSVWGAASYTWTGDFNGDGKTDLASASGGNVYVHLSTGTGFNSQTWTVPSTWGSSTYTWTGDFNGDGKTDLASASAGNVYMNISTGTGFLPATWTVPNFWGPVHLTKIADFDGDGVSDLMTVYEDVHYPNPLDQTGAIRVRFGGVSPAANVGRVIGGQWVGRGVSVIESINSGLGIETGFVYSSLAQTVGNRYLRELSLSYPRVALTPSMQVVTDVSYTEGVGGTRVSNYWYGTAVFDYTGRGFQGFAWQESFNGTSAIRSRTWYHQTFPYTGMPSGGFTFAPNSGNKLSETNYVHACYRAANVVGAPVTFNGCVVGPGERYFVAGNTTTSQSWDLNGVKLPGTQTSQWFDGWGNVSKVQVDTLDANGNQTGFRKVTDNEYFPADESSWILGRLKRATATSITP